MRFKPPRFLRFSLRTLLVVTTVAAVTFAGVGRVIFAYHAEQEALAKLPTDNDATQDVVLTGGNNVILSFPRVS